jgi:hypothetical protein
VYVRAENVTEADSDTPETPDVVVMVGFTGTVLLASGVTGFPSSVA